FGIVHRADGDVDPRFRLVVAEGQGRAAGRAEPARGEVGRLEKGRLTFCPFEACPGATGQGREQAASRLLAHAAMADMGSVDPCHMHGIEHRAALASAGKARCGAGGWGLGHGLAFRFNSQVRLAWEFTNRGKSFPGRRRLGQSTDSDCWRMARSVLACRPNGLYDV